MVRVLNMFGMGHPMAAAALSGVCSICLAWAALPYGAPLGSKVPICRRLCDLDRPLCIDSSCYGIDLYQVEPVGLWIDLYIGSYPFGISLYRLHHV